MRLSNYEKILLIEEIEAQSAADFLRSAPAKFAKEFGLYIEVDPGYVAIQVKHALELRSFNNILALGIAVPVTKAAFLRLVRLYKEAELPLSIKLSPYAHPTEIPEWLAELGFIHDGNSAKFYRDIGVREEASTNNSFRIERVGTGHIGDFVRIACMESNELLQRWLASTLERDGWHHYMAFIEDVPVATGALFIKGEVGHLGWAATLPKYRRQGAQNALLDYRIRIAGRLGCKLLSADANEATADKPNPSYHNILRNGFELAYLRPKYVYNHHSSE